MKVPSTNSIVNKYLIGLTFWVSVYERQKLIENFFFRLCVNPFNDTFATTNSFWKEFSAGNQNDLRVREETTNKLLIGLICFEILCLK